MDARPTIIEEATGLLDDVDVALVRLSEGTYRACEACGAMISDTALEDLPTLRRCDFHRDAVEQLPTSS
jgi:RNA polymerase-binding transcription factor DksA